jgi:hypothetical protein
MDKPGIKRKFFQLFKDRRGYFFPQDNPDKRIHLSLLQCAIP